MNVTASPQRSTFVSVIAWLGIVFGSFGVLVALLQLGMFQLVMEDGLDQALRDPEAALMPPVFRWMFEHFLLLMLANLVAVAVLLVASIGLLKRKNWGRIAIVALLALGIVSNVAGVGFQFVVMGQMETLMTASGAPPGVAEQFALMRFVVVGFGAIFTLAFAVLYGWIIRRLLSPAVRSEFGVG